MKYWVFDLDGTLVDSLTTHFGILKKVFNQFGADFTTENHLEVLKITAKTLPQYLELKLGPEFAGPAHDLFQRLNNEVFREIKAFDGIEELLQSLKSNGAHLAVWTARDLEATQKILTHTGLYSYFSICMSGSCTNEGKPHPEGLQRIADHFASERDSMIMVGDFDSDMLGAQAFGIKAIRVIWHEAVPAKKCEIANWQFHKVADLISWIQSDLLTGRV
jgi:phosphoglycolate phosphatase/pyrophosphatase PpaX